MTETRTIRLLCGATVIALSAGLNSAFADVIPPSILKRDFQACVEQGADGQDDFQVEYCQCVVNRMQDGMEFDEYIIFASGLSENMSNEELVKKAMSNEKVNAWVQECAANASYLIE